MSQEICPFCFCVFASHDTDKVQLRKVLPLELAKRLENSGPSVHRAHYNSATRERRLEVLVAALRAEHLSSTIKPEPLVRVANGPSFLLR